VIRYCKHVSEHSDSLLTKFFTLYPHISCPLIPNTLSPSHLHTPSTHATVIRYYKHVSEHSDSLLTKFFGLYRVKPRARGGRKVRFVVMGNLFCTDLAIHRRYDLKGSTLGRYTPGPATPEDILKDLDLAHKFR